MKIYCAAHAILACIVLVDMTWHTPAAQLEILAKTNKEWWALLYTEFTSLTAPFLSYKDLPATQVPLAHNPLMRSVANPSKHPLTTEDYKLFTGDPTSLPDKQFLLEEEDGSDSLYEVTEVRFAKRSWKYLVQFEGCIDTVTVSGEEMLEYLKRSSLVDST